MLNQIINTEDSKVHMNFQKKITEVKIPFSWYE